MTLTPQGITAFIVDKPRSMYLLLHRASTYLKGTWQMISGNIEPHETAPQAALREIIEETALHPDRLYNADAVETYYLHTLNQIHFKPVFVAFIDTPNTTPTLSSEHDDHDWVAIDVASERLLFAEQRRILTHIHWNFVLNDPNPLHRIHF